MDLSIKLEQRLTPDASGSTVRLRRHGRRGLIEGLGSGSLLEVTILHGIDLDAEASS